MFRTVAKGVISFMAAFVFLIVGFAVAFMILYLPSSAAKVTAHGDFSLVHTTLLRLNVMMLGEFYYKDLVDNQIFPGTIHIITFLFLFMISVILMNLLVGMAVSDIQGLSKSAERIQLQQQLELIVYMQDFILSPIFVPTRIREWLKSKIQNVTASNSDLVFTVKPFDSKDDVFSEKIKKNLYEHCVKKITQQKEFNRDTELKDLNKKIDDILAILSGRVPTIHSSLDSNPSFEAPSPGFRSSVSCSSFGSRPSMSRLASMRSQESQMSLQNLQMAEALHRISEENFNQTPNESQEEETSPGSTVTVVPFNIRY